MKVSFDGLRTNLALDINALADQISLMVADLSQDDVEELIDKYNDVALTVAMLNCCYYENDPNCTNLADKLEIKRL